jgi:hypothetical protein
VFALIQRTGAAPKGEGFVNRRPAPRQFGTARRRIAPLCRGAWPRYLSGKDGRHLVRGEEIQGGIHA